MRAQPRHVGGKEASPERAWLGSWNCGPTGGIPSGIFMGPSMPKSRSDSLKFLPESNAGPEPGKSGQVKNNFLIGIFYLWNAHQEPSARAAGPMLPPGMNSARVRVCRTSFLPRPTLPSQRPMRRRIGRKLQWMWATDGSHHSK